MRLTPFGGTDCRFSKAPRAKQGVMTSTGAFNYKNIIYTFLKVHVADLYQQLVKETVIAKKGLRN
jgi:hypothetical protein